MSTGKALQLRIAPAGIRPLEDTPITSLLARSGFTIGDLVTLVDSRTWEQLQKREAYRVHVVEECGTPHCGFARSNGEPDPAGDCPDGQRLAAAIGAA